MNPGESFEIKCYEYLKTHYATSDTHFAHQGGMDSTTSDIAVLKHNRVDFYMEAKDADAQSGQFVLLPDEDSRTFLFSPRNRSHSNEMTNIMIAYMNQDFDRYNRAGTAGEILDIDSGVFADWIVDHYRNKKVKYFISYGNDYVIFPIRQFTSYFDIIAKYRIKKSGSGDPAKRDFMTIKNRIVQLYPSASFSEDGKKLYAHISEPIINDKFEFGKYTYFFSSQGSNLYRIKKLSNTYHMNVIFSIHLKKLQDSDDLEEFKADL